MTAPLAIRPATEADVDEVLGMLAEAGAWLRDLGIEQWPRRFPRAQIAESVARRETFLADREGATAATFALQWEDPFFWGERPADAGYLHRVAVRRAFAGAGLGGRLVDWAAGGSPPAAAGTSGSTAWPRTGGCASTTRTSASSIAATSSEAPGARACTSGPRRRR